MKRKVLSLLIVMAMGVSLFVGCGGSDKDTGKDEDKGNNSNVSRDADDEDKDEENESKGIQTVELKMDEEHAVKISYEASVLECDGDEYDAYFYELEGDASFSVSFGEWASEMIESHKGYDWMENYTASVVTDQYINGVLVQSFTEEYSREGEPRKNELYCVPFQGGMALVVEGEFGEANLIEKALVKIESSNLKTLTEENVVVLKDASGKEIYKMYLASAEDGINLVSNENGKATFEYTSVTEEGETLTRPVEISVNAYSSPSAYFSAVSSKYWTTYDPYERDEFGGKYGYIIGFWDQKEAGELVQYQDLVFYLSLPDGNLITGICDFNQEYAVYAFFDMGLTPVQ